MESLKGHLQYMEDELTQCRKDLEKTKEQRNKANEENESLMEAIEELRLKHLSEQREIQRLEKIKTELSDNLADQNGKILQMENILRNYKNESFYVDGAKQSVGSEVVALQQEKDNLERILDEIKAENRSLHETIATLKESEQIAISKVNQSSEELKKCQEKLIELDDQIQQNKNASDAEDYKKQIETLVERERLALAEKEKICEDLNRKYQETVDELIRSKKELQKVQNNNNKLFKYNKELTENIDKLTRENSISQKKCNEFKTKEEQAHKLANELNTIKCQYSSEKAKNEQLSDEISSLKNESKCNNDILVENKNLSYKLMSLEKEILQLKQNHEKELSRYSLEYEQVSNLVTDLKRKLNAAVTEQDFLRKKNNRTLTRLDEMAPLIDQLKHKINSIFEENVKK